MKNLLKDRNKILILTSSRTSLFESPLFAMLGDEIWPWQLLPEAPIPVLAALSTDSMLAVRFLPGDFSPDALLSRTCDE
jgi:hypothetical protein